MTVQDAMARRGVVTTQADGRQRLEFHRSWPDPVEDGWSALTEPDRMPAGSAPTTASAPPVAPAPSR